jgi:hypothetical protein
LFLATAWIFVACLIGQVYLAGMGVFGGNFDDHRTFGYMLGLLPILLVVFGLLGRVGRLDIGLGVLLFVQGILQSAFVFMRESSPSLAALHPVNGVLMLLIGLYLGIDAWRLLRAGSASSAGADSATAGPA